MRVPSAEYQTRRFPPPVAAAPRVKSREASLTRVRDPALAVCFLRKVTGELAFLPGSRSTVCFRRLGWTSFPLTPSSHFRPSLPSLAPHPVPLHFKGAPGLPCTLGYPG